MTQGELESIPLAVQEQMTALERRIMEDIIERIKINGFSSATSDWEITRLQQLGESEENIRKWIKEALNYTNTEIDKVFSDDVYSEYYGHERSYQVMGFSQIPFEQNETLQQFITAAGEQTKQEFKNLTASTGFAIKNPATGKSITKKLREYYVDTLDKAMYDIHSGAFDYNTVLKRTVKELTDSGLRTIEYESKNGRITSTRVDVAARRAIMTGFRQVQAKINEQVMDDLGTEYVEVSYHVGARPTHQVWQGKVYHWDKRFSDVTNEYSNHARPGDGKITQDDGYNTSHHGNEIQVAQWLHDNLGGDITLLKESSEDGISTPDYLWDGKQWELKNVTTAKAIDSALRKGVKQISENPGGVILNCENSQISDKGIRDAVSYRVKRSCSSDIDILVLKSGNLSKVFRYKKMR